MGRLNGCVAYLCGPIDHAKDDGVEWRRTLTKQLAERYGVKVLDPTDKPFKSNTHNYEEIGAEKENAMLLKETKQFGVLASKMKEIVRADLRCVDLSDILIAYIPKNTPLCGTIHEIVVAAESKKPTLLIVEGGRKEASNWFWGLLPITPHTEDRSGWILDSWDSFFSFMDEVDDDAKSIPEPKTSRWVILDIGSR